MAITTTLTNASRQAFLDGVHSPGDTYKMAFYSSAATLDATTAAYSATNEVTNGAACPAGGVTLTGRSSGVSAGVGYIDFADVSFTVTGTFTARGCLIYNASKSNAAIAAFDYGSDKVATDGPFQVQIPASGTGVIRFS